MDPTLILLFGAIILGLIAQGWVSAAFRRYSRIGSMRGVTGAQVARDILARNGLGNVPVERVAGRLSDHYDPKAKALRLSEGVHDSASLAAIGVAAHEAGHALQDAKGFAPFRLRNGIFPLANIGSQMLWPAVIGGLFLGVKPLLWIGILLYSFAVLFSIVTLPVEFDASRRALSIVTTGGYLTAEEKTGARKVLTAAAMTYVAATLVAVLQLIRLLYLSRSDD
jgi:Zn-dependent membrane protease YugP